MKPYVPELLPPRNLNYRELIGLVGKANAKLAEYNGLLQGIINPEIMLSPLEIQEAVSSSKIEGTQATLEEVFEFEAGNILSESKMQDIEEITNYREAMLFGEKKISRLPVNLQLVLKLHKILMRSVRGENKSPGQWRKIQNWIGPHGTPKEKAKFIPPSPKSLRKHLSAWEEYIGTDDFDFLVQSAIIHARFEIIHPFRDGNGRVGRLLIPLFLYYKKCLSRPMFYLSNYLEKNRDEYYARLNAISKKRDWNKWIVFYLNAIIEQSTANILKVKSIMNLYKDMKVRLREVTRSQYSIQLLDALFNRPIFTINNIQNIPKSTAHQLLVRLRKKKIIALISEGRGRSSSIYQFSELMKTLKH